MDDSTFTIKIGSGVVMIQIMHPKLHIRILKNFDNAFIGEIHNKLINATPTNHS